MSYEKISEEQARWASCFVFLSCMRKISIKFKMTLWYAFFMLFLITLVLSFIFTVSNNNTRNSTHNTLKRVVSSSFINIENDDGVLEADDDLILFDDGVYLQAFDEKGMFLFGNQPSHFPHDIGFSHNLIRTVEHKNDTWYVYDLESLIENNMPVLVRGIISRSESEEALDGMVQLALITLPLILIVSVGGGYWLASRAFHPVEKIRKTAEQIGEGNDLSKRILLGEGTDEIYSLANTFDHMFDRLQKSFEAEKQFTSDAAHELRTPIAVIMSQSEFGIENAETKEEANESLSIILKQSKKMSGLLSQLLTLARADAKNQNLQKERINISELTEIVAEEQKGLAEEKNIAFHLNIHPELYVNADETLLMRLLINIISNGLNYGKANGNLWIQAVRESQQIRIRIEDDGIGIEADKLDMIWQRFYQVDSSRTANKTQGVGLGLAMSKWIAEAHNGRIIAVSKFGEGSSFTIELPEA